jgi:hypothetical protein
MKKLTLILIGLSMIFCSSCRVSPTELASNLKPDIEKTIQTTFNRNFVADKFTIIQSEGNNYEGLMEGKINENEVTYQVKITYDGVNSIYEVRPINNSLFNLILNSGASGNDTNRKKSNNQNNDTVIESEKPLVQQEEVKQKKKELVISDNSEPIKAHERPDSNTYFQYASQSWMDMSQKVTYGLDPLVIETTYIRETEGKIIIDFSNKKQLVYKIVKVIPYEDGINYIVEINGQRKTINKSPDIKGGVRFSLDKEWKSDQIARSFPASI